MANPVSLDEEAKSDKYWNAMQPANSEDKGKGVNWGEDKPKVNDKTINTGINSVAPSNTYIPSVPSNYTDSPIVASNDISSSCVRPTDTRSGSTTPTQSNVEYWKAQKKIIWGCYQLFR